MTIVDIKLIWQTYICFEIFVGNIKISFTFRIREFTKWENQIPCVLAIFQNSPDRDFFWPIFPVQCNCNTNLKCSLFEFVFLGRQPTGLIGSNLVYIC